MQIAILTGGRDYEDWRKIKGILDALACIPAITIYVGDCPTGLDHLARYYFNTFSPQTNVRVFKADWDTHGKAAGPIRNERMVKSTEGCFAMLFAFPGGRGTENTVKHAKKYKIPVVRVE